MFTRKKLSLSKHTTYLIFAFIIVLGTLVIIALSFQINKEIWKSQEIYFQREDEIKKSSIYSYLDTRKTVLCDFAAFPIVTQAVMQPNTNIANIKDFLRELSILNETHKFALLDFEGNIIATNNGVPDIEYKDKSWVHSLVDGNLTEYINLFQDEGKYYWRIASPVLYNTLPEGVIIMEFPFEQFLKEKNENSYIGLKEIYIYKNKKIYSIGNVSNGKKRRIQLKNFDLTIEMTYDSKNTEEGIKRLIGEVFIIMTLISLIGVFLLLYFLRKFVIKPITELTNTTKLMANGEYEIDFDTKHNILEISDLWENFNKMVQVVKNRESILTKRKKKAIRKNTLLHCTLEQLKSTQAQLLQQEKLASIGQLAAGVAHELNNPLGFVNGNFTVLKDYIVIMNDYIKLNEELVEEHLEQHKEMIDEFKTSNDFEFIMDDLSLLFEESEEGIERAINIVKNLKDFSRIDSEKKSQYDMNKGIENTLNVARNEYQYVADIEKNLEDLPIIEANGGEINQVILNIIVNAAQAIKELNSSEKKIISIKTFKDEKYVHCEIKDNGPGMNDVIMKKVFDPFFTTKGVGKGTGLGLNISYNIIVKKHKGDLRVESELGEGTKFTIKLPI